jgi:hypothetical protein
MLNEGEISEFQRKQEEKNLLSNSLNALEAKNPVRATFVGGKIQIVPADTNKFRCPNHKMRTIISMDNRIDEYECECGVIYRKKKG